MADSRYASLPNSGGAPVHYGGGNQLPAMAGTALALPGAASVGAGPDLSVSEIWRILSKWRRLILGASLVGLLIGLAVTLLMTPLYRSAATLEIAAQQAQVVQVGNVEPQENTDAEFMATQLGLLQSRSLAERVARQLNLANDPTIVDQDRPRASREQAAIGEVAKSMHAEPVKYSRLITVAVTGPNPDTSARVANGYADNFISSNLERRYETTAYARNFLEKRLAAVKSRLEDSERQLVDYARKEGIVLVNAETSGSSSNGGGGGNAGSSLDSSTLVALNAALAQAQNDRIAAQQRYAQAQSSRSTTELYQSSTLQALRQKRDDLQAQYDQNLTDFKPDLPAMVKLKSQINSLNADIRNETRGASNAIGGDYAAAVARESALQARVNQLKSGLLDLRGRSIQYNILQREVDTNRTLYDGLLQRFKEVGIAAGVGANMVSIVDRARTPGRPISPILWLNLLIGLGAGLVLGIAAALGIEFVDDTIATPVDLEQKLGVTSLGVIPMVPKSESFVEQLADPKSATAEAHYSVRTALQFATESGVPASLLITSSQAGEGKSSTALALAQNFAGSGKRVLLVDADLRKPTFRTQSGDVYGLSNLLTGDDLVEKAIHKTSVDNLFILPSGHIPPNPAELVSGTRMRELLARLTEVFDLVILDGPPVLGLADAPLLSSIAAGTMLIFESGVVRRPAAANAVNRLRAANCRLIGGVLTKYSERFGAAGYGYGYGYGSEAYSYGHRDEVKMIDLAVTE
jgi:succinoglycan biosynthesis transport protein ExoP